jgi:hypothetical protein
VVSDSPDDASPAGRSGKENQAEPNETSGRDGGKSVAGRVGQPCRYSTEEEHLVAFLENGREGGEGYKMMVQQFDISIRIVFF